MSAYTKPMSNSKKPVYAQDLALLPETLTFLDDARYQAPQEAEASFQHPYAWEIWLELAIIAACAVVVKVLSVVYS